MSGAKSGGAVPLRPIVKWAGGKRQLLEAIRASYPPGLGDTVKKYAEPFVGGGAVLLDILSRFPMEAVYISDVNQELINVYRVIRDQVPELIEALSGMEAEYLPLDGGGRRSYYQGRRDRFNSRGGGAVERAALFIFLNRTCFNGLYRVNRSGRFNVPIGAYKRPLICDGENLRNVSRAFQAVDIVEGDYRQAGGFVDGDTFVYFDPPYRPLSATAGFTSYTEAGFGDGDQIRLAQFAMELGRRGARVMLSNSDPKNGGGTDAFFDDLYAPFHIQRVEAARAINSAREKRGRITELLITSYPPPIPPAAHNPGEAIGEAP